MRASSDRRERTRRPYATRQLGLERSHRCRRFRALVRRERLHGTRLVAREQHTALLDSSVFHVNSSLVQLLVPLVQCKSTSRPCGANAQCRCDPLARERSRIRRAPPRSRRRAQVSNRSEATRRTLSRATAPSRPAGPEAPAARAPTAPPRAADDRFQARHLHRARSLRSFGTGTRGPQAAHPLSAASPTAAPLLPLATGR